MFGLEAIKVKRGLFIKQKVALGPQAMFSIEPILIQSESGSGEDHLNSKKHFDTKKNIFL